MRFPVGLLTQVRQTEILPLAVATFPIEYLKTVSQFAPRDLHGNRQRLSPIEVVRTTLQKEGPKGLFRGCSALVVGNAGKAGVRFFAFERFRSMLKNKTTVCGLSVEPEMSMRGADWICITLCRESCPAEATISPAWALVSWRPSLPSRQVRQSVSARTVNLFGSFTD